MYVICIDGTADTAIPAEYDKAMKGSFVRKISGMARDSSEVDAVTYIQGPTTAEWDRSTHDCFEDALKWAIQIQASGVSRPRSRWKFGNFGRESDLKFFLVGYSRGAAACIAFAWGLLEASEKAELDPIPMVGLALFDAVERSPSLWVTGRDTTVIPRNVARAYHAVRGALKGDPDGNGPRSRPEFGTTGQQLAPGVVYLHKTFRATHAALGGCPWTGDHPVHIEETGDRFAMSAAERGVATRRVEPLITKAQDVRESQKVWDWMLPHLIKERVLTGWRRA